HFQDQLGSEFLVAALPAFQRVRVFVRVAALDAPGIERLQRDLARAVPRRGLRILQRHFAASSWPSRPLSSATRTASAPLSLRASACASVSTVRMPLATGRPL